MQNLDAIRAMLGQEDVSLVFLPLAHTLTKIIALVGVESGIKMAFATDISHLREEFPWFGPPWSSGYHAYSRRSTTVRSTRRA